MRPIFLMGSLWYPLRIGYEHQTAHPNRLAKLLCSKANCRRFLAVLPHLQLCNGDLHLFLSIGKQVRPPQEKEKSPVRHRASLTSDTVFSGDGFIPFSSHRLSADYADRCMPAVIIPAPIKAVPPVRLNHLRTPVFLIASRNRLANKAYRAALTSAKNRNVPPSRISWLNTRAWGLMNCGKNATKNAMPLGLSAVTMKALLKSERAVLC